MVRPCVAILLAILAGTGCRGTGARGASPEASGPAPRCEVPAAASLDPASGPASILGRPLAPCSAELHTGWFRDGSCNTDAEDRGVHVVCAQVSDAFLQFSRGNGNDLITPRPEMRFPGLRAGDRWCLCAERWREALEAGVAPPVIPEATHAKALRHVTQEDLLAHPVTR